MNYYSGKVRRDLSERRFSYSDKRNCRTGGSCLGCPFLKCNISNERICTLYRLKPITCSGHFIRVTPCIENKTPPVKRYYLFDSLYKVLAVSEEEAREIYHRAFGRGARIGIIKEGKIVEFEEII